jgi:Na+/proline symporter
MFANLHTIDILIICSYLVFTFLIGIYFSRRASKNMDEFFVSGRSLPWWIVGTSMVATTFAADTPLAVSGLVAKGGIWKNWLWWNTGMGAMVAVFLFARLWNRARITTDAELIELRYDGKAAAALRGYRAVWFGMFQNLIVIAWVMKAMSKIIVTIMGWEKGTVMIMGMDAEVFTMLVLFVLTVFYTALSGLWGVVATDFVQFIIAMAGSIYLAVMALHKLGGMDAVAEKITGHGFNIDQVLNIIPRLTPLTEFTPFTEFLVLILIIWWTLSNIDGGGYLAQRLFAAKNERHSMFAFLWFSIAHICLRPWPWIVVGLCGMAYFGKVEDPETYYPLIMNKFLPIGMMGVMVASFLAAFMSTIDTQLNWGASLLVNDCYKRFFRKKASQREYIIAARIIIVFLALLGGIVSFAIKDISQAWVLLFSVTAGLGTVYILRWYWWRVNAWSEISVLVSALIATMLFKGIPFLGYIDAIKDTFFAKGLAGTYPGQQWFVFPYSILVTILFIIPIWLIVTLMTRPVSRDHLIRFYKKVYPGGPGWKIVAKEVPGYESQGLNGKTFVNMILGIMVMNFFLVGTGKLILGHTLAGGLLLLAAVGAGAWLYYNLKE